MTRNIEFLERTASKFVKQGNRAYSVRHSGIEVTAYATGSFDYFRLNEGGSVTPLSRGQAVTEFAANQALG